MMKRILTRATASLQSSKIPFLKNNTFNGYTPSSLFLQQSNFSSNSSKLLNTLLAEIEHENKNFESPSITKQFLDTHKEWKFESKDGDVNMALTKTQNGNKVIVDYQLVSPFQANEENETQSEMTDFSVTVEAQNGNGITFYCTTLQNDDKYRFMIGNIRYFEDEEAKNSVSSFNGPQFEDLDDSLQESLDEWLNGLGIDNELCNFIDACSVDKEQVEYMLWLKKVAKFVEKN